MNKIVPVFIPALSSSPAKKLALDTSYAQIQAEENTSAKSESPALTQADLIALKENKAIKNKALLHRLMNEGIKEYADNERQVKRALTYMEKHKREMGGLEATIDGMLQRFKEKPPENLDQIFDAIKNVPEKLSSEAKKLLEDFILRTMTYARDLELVNYEE